MSLKSDIPFGAWVVTPTYLVRYKDGNKRWWVVMRFEAPKKCMFLGARNFTNGTVDYYPEHDDMGGDIGGGSYEYSADELIKGALVCPKSGKPFKTLLDDCRYSLEADVITKELDKMAAAQVREAKKFLESPLGKLITDTDK